MPELGPAGIAVAMAVAIGSAWVLLVGSFRPFSHPAASPMSVKSSAARSILEMDRGRPMTGLGGTGPERDSSRRKVTSLSRRGAGERPPKNPRKDAEDVPSAESKHACVADAGTAHGARE